MFDIHLNFLLRFLDLVFIFCEYFGLLSIAREKIIYLSEKRKNFSLINDFYAESRINKTNMANAFFDDH